MMKSGQPSPTVPELSSGRSTAFGVCTTHSFADVHGDKTGPSTFPPSPVQETSLAPSPRRCALASVAANMISFFGHHRAACAVAGVLGKRGYPLECAAAQVCREAGASVSINVPVRDLDLVAHNNLDGRRLEVIADGRATTGDRHDTGLAFATRWVCQSSTS